MENKYMGAEQRAEIGPQNDLSPEPRLTGRSNLPHWVNPVLAARLTLASLIGLGAVAVDHMTSPIVTAQTNCKGTEREFTVVGMQVPFLDMARVVLEDGRKGIFDKGNDPYLEMPALGGELKVVDPISKRELASSNFTTQPPRIPNVRLPHLDENLAWAVGRWCATPNTTITLKDGWRVPAVEVIVKSSQHPENESYRVTVPAGGSLPNWFGREVKNPADFLDMADKKVAPVRDLDAKKEKLIRDWLAVHKVAVTGVVTPIAASRVISTATYTEEVRAAVKQDIVDQIAKATGDLQNQALTTNTRLDNLNTALQEQKKSLEGTGRSMQALEKTILDLKTTISPTVQAPTPPTSTVPSGGVFEEIGKLAGGLPGKEVWPWALGILIALGSILGYRSWMPDNYTIRGRVIPVHLNIRKRRII